MEVLRLTSLGAAQDKRKYLAPVVAIGVGYAFECCDQGRAVHVSIQAHAASLATQALRRGRFRVNHDPELRRLARELTRLVNFREGQNSVFRFPGDDESTFADTDVLARLADVLLQIRAIRSNYLPQDLFGEPGWDILLDLYLHRRRAKRVSVTSACIAARVPPTTALRWISELIDRGLIEREGDPKDRRRAFLSLTEAGERDVTRALMRAFEILRDLFAPEVPPTAAP